MAPSNAREKWTDQSIMSLCNFLIEYQNNNGRSKGFPWIQLQPEYEKIHNHGFISKQALKVSLILCGNNTHFGRN